MESSSTVYIQPATRGTRCFYYACFGFLSDRMSHTVWHLKCDLGMCTDYCSYQISFLWPPLSTWGQSYLKLWGICRSHATALRFIFYRSGDVCVFSTSSVTQLAPYSVRYNTVIIMREHLSFCESNNDEPVQEVGAFLKFKPLWGWFYTIWTKSVFNSTNAVVYSRAESSWWQNGKCTWLSAL